MADTGIEANKKDRFDPFKRFYVGQVVANDDPKTLGRVRVEIPGLTKGMELDAMPWYSVKLPSVLGGSVYTGLFGIPQVNTMVVVEFMDESIYSGIVTGSLLNRVTFPDDKLNLAVDYIHPKSSEHHFTENWDMVDDRVPDQKQFSPDMAEDYPFCWGWVDNAMNWFKVNMMKRTAELVFNNFLKFKTYPNGDTIIHIPGNLKLVIEKDFYTEVRGSEDHIVFNNKYEHVLANNVTMTEHMEIRNAKRGMCLQGQMVSIN